MGAYLAWSLLAAEVLFSAARNDDMPRVLAYENRNKTPAAALLMTNLFVQLCLVLTLFAEDVFFIVLKLTGSMALIPYFLVYAGGLKFVLLSTLIYAPGTALYVWARKEQGKRVFKPFEWVLFGLALAGCAVGIHGLVQGYISV